MRYTLLNLILLLCGLIVVDCGNGKTLKVKRALVYPGKVTKLQYILGVGLPIDLDDYAIAIGHILKASFLLPTNATDYTNPGVIYTRRKKRSMMLRWDVYDILSEIAELKGIGGRSCVLRTICELADTPLNTKQSLMGELLHTLFTPSTTKEDINHHADNEYLAAHRIGREAEGTCHRFFGDCSFNFVDLFSKIY
nr:uncharacterized protein LOC111413658 [Onthophagus taurus]